MRRQAIAQPSAAGNIRKLEMQAILDSLDRHRGAKPKAAQELAVSLETFGPPTVIADLRQLGAICRLYREPNATSPVPGSGCFSEH